MRLTMHKRRSLVRSADVTLTMIHGYVARLYASWPRQLQEEIVCETALELVERGRRHPEQRHTKWNWIKFSALTAVRNVGRREYKHLSVPLWDAEHDLPIDLAVPPNQFDSAHFAERLSDEADEDAIEELAFATPMQIRERDRLTRIYLGTSPDPLCRISLRRRRHSAAK